jgi:hypothetical protein
VHHSVILRAAVKHEAASFNPVDGRNAEGHPASQPGAPHRPSSTDPDLLHQVLGDGLQLHVAGAFVDRADLAVAVELLHRVLAGEAVAAEQVDAGAGDALQPSADSPRTRQDVFIGVTEKVSIDAGLTAHLGEKHSQPTFRRCHLMNLSIVP